MCFFFYFQYILHFKLGKISKVGDLNLCKASIDYRSDNKVWILDADEDGSQSSEDDANDDDDSDKTLSEDVSPDEEVDDDDINENDFIGGVSGDHQDDEQDNKGVDEDNKGVGDNEVSEDRIHRENKSKDGEDKKRKRTDDNVEVKFH